MDEIESVLCIIRQVMVYRIPVRSSSKGYKASDWDVSHHMWTGRLRIVSKKEKAYIRLEDPNTGELFATCPYLPDELCVEPVTDSSRYFVLKIVDIESGHKAFVGIGFQDRSEAFDFNVALQDYTKRLKSEITSSAESNASTDFEPMKPDPKLDLSLKEGQKIKINLGSISFSPMKEKLTFDHDNAINPFSNTNNKSKGLGSFVLPILPPPPRASTSIQTLDPWSTNTVKTHSPLSSTKSKEISMKETESDDGWDDFQSVELSSFFVTIII